MSDVYTTKMAAEITGELPRNIQSYVEQNVIEPEFGPVQRRSGKPYQFSRQDLIEIGMLRTLIDDYGFDLRRVRSILQIFKRKAWIKKHGLGDFYDSWRWGKARECLLTTAYKRPLTEMGPNVPFFLSRDENEKLELSPEFLDHLRNNFEKGLGTLLVPLGAIKNEVVKRLGL